MIEEVENMLKEDSTALDRHRLEVIRGFLNYVFQTYHALKPFLIGFHMTIDSWRGGRDDQGWKQKRKGDEEPKGDGEEEQHAPTKASNGWDKLRRKFKGFVRSKTRIFGPEAPPLSKVKAVPRLQGDIQALKHLMRAERPPLKRARCKNKASTFYGFGDASGSGFGVSFEVNGEVLFQYGQWSLEVTEETSSNWKELANLVQGVKKVLHEYKVGNCEIFIFTDNTTAEGAFWKGTAKSPRLFELMLELKMLELEHSLILHVIHVSGDRMRSQGTDGLSRADHSQGVMAGKEMKEFIPLHLSALDREDRVRKWLNKITEGLDCKLLTPEGWFDDAHAKGNFIWTPPPAAAEVVVEQLAKARHKRPECLHIIVVPRLMTGRWRRKLIRGCDGYFRLLSDDVWPLETHFEPLMIFVCLPFYSWMPMHMRGLTCWNEFTGLCFEATCRRHLDSGGGIFCANFLQKRGPYAPCRGAWCGKCYTPRGFKPFPIRKQLDEDGEELVDPGGELRFLEARNGDHLMISFQCDICHFRNILKRDPNHCMGEDREILEYIRRASLDAFWSREPSTVRNNTSNAGRIKKTIDRLRLPSLIPPMGPFPLEDLMGMGLAIVVLDRSLDPGVHDTFVQFETTRKTRSTITNIYQASVGGLSDAIGSYERNKLWITKVSSHSFWFVRFMTGFHKRVGDIKKQDKAITIEVLHAVMELLEQEWRRYKKDRSKTLEDAKRVAEIGSWFVVGFCLGLRGEEMPLIEMSGTAQGLHQLSKPEPYFTVVVSGRTKNNNLSGAKFNVPCVSKTQGCNIHPARWVKRLVVVRQALGRTKGRLFQRNLHPPRLFEFEDDFMTLLERVQSERDVIEGDVDVREEYGILRSLRKGNAAHALNMEIDATLIRTFNRWRKEMEAGTRSPHLDMLDLYASWEAITPTLLRYTRGL